MRFVATLLTTNDVLQTLLEVYCQSKEEAIARARKLALSDIRFDANLLHCFTNQEDRKWSDEALLIGLDILDAVSERDRLVLGVMTFLKHANPKVRSKAALFISRRRPNLTWIADLTTQSDARVRANIIEGLYGIKEDFIARLFRKHVNDPDNRVAGNAILGLYRLGDADSILLIDDLAKHENPKFRVTSAWCMGQTGDPRFANALVSQLSDADKLVRKQALLALGNIKKALAEVRNRNPLRLAIRKHRSESDTDCISTTVRKDSEEIVRQVLPTEFLVKAGGKYIRQYRVQEYDRSAPIEVVFAVCLPPGEDPVFNVAFEQALRGCSTILRPKDKLQVINLSHKTQLGCSAREIRESTAVMKKVLENIDFGSPHLNLVVVGANSETLIIDRLIDIGSNVAAALYVVAVAPEWKTSELRRRVVANDGMFRESDQFDLSETCFEICLSLLHHYRIEWKKAEGDIELEVRSADGRGSAVYQD